VCSGRPPPYQDVVAITAVEAATFPRKRGIDCQRVRPPRNPRERVNQGQGRRVREEVGPGLERPEPPEGAVFLDPDCLPAAEETLTLEPAPGPLAFGVVVWITNEVFATSTTNPCSVVPVMEVYSTP